MRALLPSLALALAGPAAWPTFPAQAQAVSSETVKVSGRWSEERINAWYDEQPWIVGANYVPRNAINQLEMWQEGTFSPDLIDEELGWAAAIGMNSMRVFLHDLAWKQDPEGFLRRVDAFLAICEKHGIRPMFVLFDDVWDPSPMPGPQPAPRPHLHNSGWVQSPGKAILGDPARHDELKPYVDAVFARFGKDKRVLAWDLYNEPGNMVRNSYGDRGTGEELVDKPRFTLMLLQKVFRWARAANPDQPLSAGVFWHTAATPGAIVRRGSWEVLPVASLQPINQFAFANSDFINWHNYDHVGYFAAEIAVIKQWNRPLFLTEYLARDHAPAKGTNGFSHMLPVARAARIGMYNWGLVDGKSQTKYPWATWDETWTRPPHIWHHDIFRSDGTPYDSEETELIRFLTNGSDR